MMSQKLEKAKLKIAYSAFLCMPVLVHDLIL